MISTQYQVIFRGTPRRKKKESLTSVLRSWKKALAADIKGELNDARFIPYIQLHEFEALILGGSAAA